MLLDYYENKDDSPYMHMGRVAEVLGIITI